MKTNQKNFLGRMAPSGVAMMGLMAMTLATGPLLTGCSTTGGGNAAAVTTVATVAKSAAYVGTTVWLQKHPETKPQFIQARDAVKGLIAAGTFNASDLSAALKGLPIAELKGDAGTMIVAEAVVLWDSYGKQLAALDSGKTFETYVLPVAVAIQAGLDMALGN